MVGGTHRVPGPQGPGPCRLWVGTRPTWSVMSPAVIDARYDHIVILGVAIGLIVGSTLMAKLIASDDHHEPY